MKNPNLLCIFFLFFIFNVKGQNLVPNGDFEQYIGCPYAVSQLDLAQPWVNPATNIANVSGTPDYFNQCATFWQVSIPNNILGFQPAHSGNGYCGIYLWLMSPPANAREYIEAPLSAPLDSNVCYHFEMYVNLGNVCNYTADAIGVYFSTTLISGINNYFPLPYTPQINNTAGIFDSTSWTLVSGNYVAQGGENYLIIGNYSNDANTSLVSVNNSGFDIAYVYIDDVSLTPCNELEIPFITNTLKYLIYPNPVKDYLVVSSQYELKKQTEIIITDISGRKIFIQFESNNPKSEIKIDVSQLNSGIYFVEINDGKNILRKNFLKE